MAVGPAHGLEQPCAVSCDNIITIEKGALGRHVGSLFDRQEQELTAAILNAFALALSIEHDRYQRAAKRHR